MTPLTSRRLIVVTGKGGAGKTTVSAALGLLGARRGLRTIVVEVVAPRADPDADAHAGGGGGGRLAELLGHGVGGNPIPAPHGVETELYEGLWSVSVDRDRVLAEWLRAIGGRVPARMLTSSSTFQYLVAAAPGTREMLAMVKVWELAEGRRPADRRRRGAARAGGTENGNGADGDTRGSREYDLVILDGPATGHALAMLRSPHTYAAIARTGPVARQAGQVRDLLTDPGRSAYVAVAHPTEMAVTETLELREGLRRDLGRELDAVVVNATLPRRFARGELQQLAALRGPSPGETPTEEAVRSAVRAAHAAHERARAQQSQLARLRRDAERTGAPVLSVPFLFRAELDLDALQRIAARLGRGM